MRSLVLSKTFNRNAKKFFKLHPDLTSIVLKTMKLLEIDVNVSRLKTHKLSGKLSQCFACRINLSYRIIFTYDDEHVYLINIGDHDDVY